MSGGEKVSLCVWFYSIISRFFYACTVYVLSTLSSADLPHSFTCRDCSSLRIRFWTRLGPNYLISSGYYLRLAFLPYKRIFNFIILLKYWFIIGCLKTIRNLDNYEIFCCKDQWVEYAIRNSVPPPPFFLLWLASSEAGRSFEYYVWFCFANCYLLLSDNFQWHWYTMLMFPPFSLISFVK